mmetsp:Transcript_2791/g.6689  ORF Transcript_2791/g.6689 Transcript_2791/m.6689 type:complete len:184 (-) Transcript_2791:1229-1780(-)
MCTIVWTLCLVLAISHASVSVAISDFTSQSIDLKLFSSINSNPSLITSKNNLVAHSAEDVNLGKETDLVGGGDVGSWTNGPETSARQSGEDARLKGCSRLRGGAGKKRCVVQGCKQFYMQVAGDCQYCDLKFCPDHRLPEEHACKNLCLCKEAAYNNNYMQLAEEAKAVAVRRENMIRGQPNN